MDKLMNEAIMAIQYCKEHNLITPEEWKRAQKEEPYQRELAMRCIFRQQKHQSGELKVLPNGKLGMKPS